jgi:hypothetical protein
VNFFGHALVASWHGRGGRFALGAMLPDFATMLGARLVGADDPEVADGIALHHATDRVFHGLAPFARAQVAIAGELMARGLPRGPARGVAHVAFELSLDGALLDEPGGAGAYLDALAGAGDAGPALRWSDPGAAARWATMRARLAGYGVPVDYGVPERVAERVERVLSRRPLLALDEPGARLVRAAMPSIAARAAASAPAVLDGLRAALESPTR